MTAYFNAPSAAKEVERNAEVMRKELMVLGGGGGECSSFTRVRVQN